MGVPGLFPETCARRSTVREIRLRQDERMRWVRSPYKSRCTARLQRRAVWRSSPAARCLVRQELDLRACIVSGLLTHAYQQKLHDLHWKGCWGRGPSCLLVALP